MEITVKIELGTKERKLVEELIARLGELRHSCACSCENLQPEAEPQKDPTSEPMPDPDDAFAAFAVPQTAEPTPEPEGPTPEQWRARIREIMQQYVITDKRDAIKDLLTKYGVAKASALPDDKLEDFARDLTKVCEG